MYCPMTGRTINDLRNAPNVPGRVTLVVHLTEGSHSYSDRNRTSLRTYCTPLLYPPLSDTEFATLLCSSETCEGPEGSQRAPCGGESRVRRFIVSSFKIFSCFATKACQVDMCSVNASQSPIDLRRARCVPWPSGSCTACGLRGPTHRRQELDK
jgi:hypothetical protein